MNPEAAEQNDDAVIYFYEEKSCPRSQVAIQFYVFSYDGIFKKIIF